MDSIRKSVTLKRSLCIMIFFILVYLVYDWDWIKSLIKTESGGQTFIASLIGALIGGTIGGVGSYLGGIEGARRNFDLISDQDKKHARLRLLKHLRFTYRLLRAIIRENRNATRISLLTYDKCWPEQVAKIDNITDKEFEEIILWFTRLDALQHAALKNQGLLLTHRVKREFTEENLNKMDKIIKRVSNLE